jgi:esterase/lipase
MFGRILISFILCTSATTVLAEKISTKLPSGILVNAQYMPGDSERPALLVLHGFLQTNEFLATKSIAEGLSEMDYSVLSPSLSLGVSNRRKSLSCEAMHKHTLADDLEEIEHWVNWLHEKGHQSIVLVGHSWGGQHALAYVDKYSHRKIKGVTTVSLVRSRQDDKTLISQIKRANENKKNGVTGPNSYALNFCTKYIGTEDSFLSYAQWTDAKVIESMPSPPLPVYTILGGKDKRVDKLWIDSLRNAGAKVSIIENADHFFSSTHEFDLLDELQNILENFNTESTH